MSESFRFASAVAGYGMLVGGFAHPGSLDLDRVLELASGSAGDDPLRLRWEFIELVRASRWLPR
jgi:Ca-activated chloride channel family protein